MASPTLRRQLERAGEPELCARRPIRPGNRLVRRWRGCTYVVDAVEDGFIYDGRTYASLSEIARLITGTRWSGPRFFGPVQ